MSSEVNRRSAAESMQRAPYGRQTSREVTPWSELPRDVSQGYDGRTYYDIASLKPHHYRHLIAGYLFVGGIAGSAQILAQVADLVGDEGDRSVVRHGRYLALAGSAASPVLLIADLHTPQRWYNMMRIFRPTSAMSIGSWTLAAFGTFSGLTAAAQMLHDWTGRPAFRRLARWFGAPAAAAGGMMSVYTGTLLSATNVPLWTAADKLLPIHFATSAMTTAAAALNLCEASKDSPTCQRLDRVALVSLGAEALTEAALEARWHAEHLHKPLQEEPTRTMYRVGTQLLGVALPFALYAVNAVQPKPSRKISWLAAGSALVGGFLLRKMLLRAGHRSAERSQDYFQYAQPGRLPGHTAASAVSTGTQKLER